MSQVDILKAITQFAYKREYVTVMVDEILLKNVRVSDIQFSHNNVSITYDRKNGGAFGHFSLSGVIRLWKHSDYLEYEKEQEQKEGN